MWKIGILHLLLIARCSSTAGFLDEKTAASSTLLRDRRDINLAPKKALPLDFLEVPVTTKKNITATPPPPNVSLRLVFHERVLHAGTVVNIGSSLKMVVSLDPKSAAVYGLRVSGLDASSGDGNFTQILIENGCAADDSIFPDFKQIERGTSEAIFKAFRFPGSTDVRFAATVRVCRQRCPRLPCSSSSRSARDSRTSNSTKVLLPDKKSYDVIAVADVSIKGVDPQFMLGPGHVPSKRKKTSSAVRLDLNLFLILFLVNIAFSFASAHLRST